MTQPRKTPYVSVNLTVPARDALQRAAINVSAAVGKRVSMSAALLAALAVAEERAEEFARQIEQSERNE